MSNANGFENILTAMPPTRPKLEKSAFDSSSPSNNEIHVPNILPELTCLNALGLNFPSFTTGVLESLEYCFKLGVDIVSKSIGLLQGCNTKGAAIMDEAQIVVRTVKVGSGRKRSREAILTGWANYMRDDVRKV
jgi:hypothetical protein